MNCGIKLLHVHSAVKCLHYVVGVICKRCHRRQCPIFKIICNHNVLHYHQVSNTMLAILSDIAICAILMEITAAAHRKGVVLMWERRF